VTLLGCRALWQRMRGALAGVRSWDEAAELDVAGAAAALWRRAAASQATRLKSELAAFEGKCEPMNLAEGERDGMIRRLVAAWRQEADVLVAAEAPAFAARLRLPPAEVEERLRWYVGHLFVGQDEEALRSVRQYSEDTGER